LPEDLSAENANRADAHAETGGIIHAARSAHREAWYLAGAAKSAG
jgi:hypothetical protein